MWNATSRTAGARSKWYMSSLLVIICEGLAFVQTKNVLMDTISCSNEILWRPGGRRRRENCKDLFRNLAKNATRNIQVGERQLDEHSAKEISVHTEQQFPMEKGPEGTAILQTSRGDGTRESTKGFRETRLPLFLPSLIGLRTISMSITETTSLPSSDDWRSIQLHCESPAVEVNRYLAGLQEAYPNVHISPKDGKSASLHFVAPELGK
ncbi:hypothetical protein EDD36DRAFT_10517 [Exophiala viscosa]|uniref:Uncharacterized protein n=1 Tax=Exophiala viscosa TaxID=2486360 RepID=A0AAN6IHW8_9EURO|nr:hypothetical protein EDD36DRAFT_10517 [Exophiala viscosa]